MTYRPQALRITADQVAEVRKALDETQDEFAQRFSRSRFAVIRWEAKGVKFKYKSQRYTAWNMAVHQAISRIKLMDYLGTEREQTQNLRALRILST